MADNTQLDPGSGGDVVATDDIGGVKHQRVKLEFGGDGVATEVDHGDPLPSIDLAASAALALDADLGVFNANGWNPGFSTGVEETFWSIGASSWQDTPNNSAELVNVASTDAADAAAGTGAQTVRVHGLNSSGAYATEDVSMNGTSNVSTVATFLVVFRLEVLTVGSGATNAGAISATGATSSGIYAYALAGEGTSEQATHAVPASTVGLLKSWRTGVLETGTAGAIQAQLQIWIPTTQPTWRTIQRTSAADGAPSNLVFDPPLVLPATSRVRVQGIASASVDAYSSLDVLQRAS